MVTSLNNNLGTEFHADEQRHKMYTILFIVVLVLVVMGVGILYQMNTSNETTPVVTEKVIRMSPEDQLKLLADLRTKGGAATITATSTAFIKQQQTVLKKLADKSNSTSSGTSTSAAPPNKNSQQLYDQQMKTLAELKTK